MRKGWIETKLGEVAEWGSGGTPKAGFREYYDGDIPWCVIGDLTENAVWHTEKMITELGLDNSSAKLIRSGSVLLAMYGASIGRTGISGVPMATNQAIASAIVHERILDAKYLLYFLQTQKSRFVESGQGAAQPNISQGIIKSWPINLPPLRAQKRIVDLISSVDSYVEALRQQADSARRSRNAILNEMLTAGVDGWQEYELGDLLLINRGGSPRPIQSYFTNDLSGINWIKIADATASEKYIYETKQKITRDGIARSRLVKSGDFILSNSMSYGRPYIMRTEGCIHDGWLLLSQVGDYFDEDFLYNLLLTDSVQKQFDSLSAGSGVQNLNIEVVKKVRVRIPSINEQRRISVSLNSFDAFLFELESAITSVTSLRSALLQGLLSGEHEILESYDSIMGAA